MLYMKVLLVTHFENIYRNFTIRKSVFFRKQQIVSIQPSRHELSVDLETLTSVYI